jgi:hypothetical protein
VLRNGSGVVIVPGKADGIDWVGDSKNEEADGETEKCWDIITRMAVGRTGIVELHLAGIVRQQRLFSPQLLSQRALILAYYEDRGASFSTSVTAEHATIWGSSPGYSVQSTNRRSLTLNNWKRDNSKRDVRDNSRCRLVIHTFTQKALWLWLWQASC